MFVSASIVTHLPCFHGPLSFHLETGYVGVDEVQFFYYFIESEGNLAEDPLLLWATGGPGCSSFCALIFQNGPLKFRSVKYNGSLPTLVYHPFAFACKRYLWLINHPKFLSNPLYVGGDSYAGKVVPFITQLISQGTGVPITFDPEARENTIRKGYTDLKDTVQRVPAMNREDYENPTKALCAKKLQVAEKYFDEINMDHILEPKCPPASPKQKNLSGERRSLKDGHNMFTVPPDVPPLKCRSYGYYLSGIWANDDVVRDALHIQKKTVPEWIRCNDNLQYAYDLPSNVKYQHKLTSRGYRALVYSGDHDLTAPHIGTQTWIRSLNCSIIDDWRSWFSGGQVTGYTRTYANNLTFATIYGAGHTGPEYKPRESLAMVKRWLSYQPL
ncbi:LOW QUALITY PROTEIN: serine carboxypeptidase-like 18 [Dioscorea cayenensis subsp. rotundata]|uniref:LOW QUALITY PROTEIN: serine carboxypeptidase-like 18 n=1 Tax=Dioscorea cayennensis subsp. rotundata TaxID=55577 RepID=A0AB40CSJ1_DIOCR|nr:LOW QUALITY PROTEIN: serine carboxypeptidase-like 18 [Dioscorea cayenensis subsp. rotundata]